MVALSYVYMVNCVLSFKSIHLLFERQNIIVCKQYLQNLRAVETTSNMPVYLRLHALKQFGENGA